MLPGRYRVAPTSTRGGVRAPRSACRRRAPANSTPTRPGAAAGSRPRCQPNWHFRWRFRRRSAIIPPCDTGRALFVAGDPDALSILLLRVPRARQVLRAVWHRTGLGLWVVFDDEPDGQPLLQRVWVTA